MILRRVEEAQGFACGSGRPHPAEDHGEAGRIHFGHGSQVEGRCIGRNRCLTFGQQGGRARHGHRTGYLDLVAGDANHFLTDVASPDLFLACRDLIRPSMPLLRTSAAKESR
jgi:hypothetical protein